MFRVSRDGQIIGEFSEAAFASAIRRQEIKSTDLFLKEGSEKWEPVYDYRSSVELPPTPTPEKIRPSLAAVPPPVEASGTQILVRVLGATVFVIIALIALYHCRAGR